MQQVPWMSVAAILLGSLVLGGPQVGFCSQCAEGADERLTLAVREVVVDGVSVEDLAPWDLPAELTASHWEEVGVTLTIGAQVTHFALVRP